VHDGGSRPPIAFFERGLLNRRPCRLIETKQSDADGLSRDRENDAPGADNMQNLEGWETLESPSEVL
jgi:hypothetical protein